MSERAASAQIARIHAWLAIEYEDRLRSGYAGLIVAGHDDSVTA